MPHSSSAAGALLWGVLLHAAMCTSWALLRLDAAPPLTLGAALALGAVAGGALADAIGRGITLRLVLGACLVSLVAGPSLQLADLWVLETFRSGVALVAGASATLSLVLLEAAPPPRRALVTLLGFPVLLLPSGWTAILYADGLPAAGFTAVAAVAWLGVVLWVAATPLPPEEAAAMTPELCLDTDALPRRRGREDPRSSVEEAATGALLLASPQQHLERTRRMAAAASRRAAAAAGAVTGRGKGSGSNRGGGSRSRAASSAGGAARAATTTPASSSASTGTTTATAPAVVVIATGGITSTPGGDEEPGSAVPALTAEEVAAALAASEEALPPHSVFRAWVAGALFGALPPDASSTAVVPSSSGNARRVTPRSVLVVAGVWCAVCAARALALAAAFPPALTPAFSAAFTQAVYGSRTGTMEGALDAALALEPALGASTGSGGSLRGLSTAAGAAIHVVDANAGAPQGEHSGAGHLFNATVTHSSSSSLLHHVAAGRWHLVAGEAVAAAAVGAAAGTRRLGRKSTVTVVLVVGAVTAAAAVASSLLEAAPPALVTESALHALVAAAPALALLLLALELAPTSSRGLLLGVACACVYVADLLGHGGPIAVAGPEETTAALVSELAVHPTGSSGSSSTAAVSPRMDLLAPAVVSPWLATAAAVILAAATLYWRRASGRLPETRTAALRASPGAPLLTAPGWDVTGIAWSPPEAETSAVQEDTGVLVCCRVAAAGPPSDPSVLSATPAGNAPAPPPTRKERDGKRGRKKGPTSLLPAPPRERLTSAPEDEEGEVSESQRLLGAGAGVRRSRDPSAASLAGSEEGAPPLSPTDDASVLDAFESVLEALGAEDDAGAGQAHPARRRRPSLGGAIAQELWTDVDDAVAAASLAALQDAARRLEEAASLAALPPPVSDAAFVAEEVTRLRMLAKALGGGVSVASRSSRALV